MSYAIDFDNLLQGITDQWSQTEILIHFFIVYYGYIATETTHLTVG